jgi:transcriptional antiterminator RfaH
MSNAVHWILLYTKPHAEDWAAVNLRRQGFDTLLPRVRARGALTPLFPRYLFAAHSLARTPPAMQHTFGVLYVVRCGDRPAIVPPDVIAGIRERMDDRGIVTLVRRPPEDELFARRQRDRLRALEQFAAAGFRVRAA